jgi:hypothetical protein
MYVYEESPCGVVPMNHSNKDGIASAESEEGRLQLKEITFPFDTYPTQRGLRVSPGWASVRTRESLAAIYLREEPDGLVSARPDLRGEHWAHNGVPTAIGALPREPEGHTEIHAASCRFMDRR